MFLIKIDLKEWEEYLSKDGLQKQLSFAASRAMNDVIKEVQKAIRENMKEKFTLRRMAWNLNAIKITKWSNKKDLHSTLLVDPRAEYLNLHEDSTEHTPFSGKYLRIANDDVFGDRVITKNNRLFLKNLNLHKDSDGDVVGNQGTFLIETDRGTPIVLQRTGKNKNKVKKLYTFVKRSKTTSDLNFYKLAEITTQLLWDKTLTTYLEEAIKNAK